MAISLHLAENYLVTTLDFWRLRPKRFMAAKRQNPTRYMPPYQFLVLSLGIAFLCYVAAYFLSLSLNLSEPNANPEALARVLALRLVTYLCFVLLLSSLFYRAISRIWPISGRASFLSILEMQCYMQAIWLPIYALDLFLIPLFTDLEATEVLSRRGADITFLVLGTIFGTVLSLFWLIPGVATVNGVSAARIWAGLLFWGVALGFALGLVVVIITIVQIL